MSANLAEIDVAAAAEVGASASTIETNDSLGKAAAISSPESPMAAARGIVNGVLIATPFWILFGVAVVLLR